MLISKTIELKTLLAQLLKDRSATFPKVITFTRGINFPKYKITIEEIEEDFFIDSKGVKWIKAKAEDQDI
jgi:hypothetical protein